MAADCPSRWFMRLVLDLASGDVDHQLAKPVHVVLALMRLSVCCTLTGGELVPPPSNILVSVRYESGVPVLESRYSEL